ncbi:hypothetical protein AMS68_005529 [Peltaster fructicola]|uniref:SMP domain-containing protein n=1 Tax=Peltaster fructicola TaxID=286661 RepID=A0A6H0XZ13_9PEZI|nr:hypothetical protein AMS68_005529 [Peltaster fructicola]
MSSEQSPLEIAKQAERDLNSHAAKTGNTGSDSSIDESATTKFPGSTVRIGGTGSGDNREIPEDEGGVVSKTGRLTKASDFEGRGADQRRKQAAYAADNGGNDDVQDNVRQGGETRRP